MNTSAIKISDKSSSPLSSSACIEPSRVFATARMPLTIPPSQLPFLKRGIIRVVWMRFDMASVIVPSMPYPVVNRTFFWSFTKRMSSPLSLFFLPIPHLRNSSWPKSKMSSSPMLGSITTAVSMPVLFSKRPSMALIESRAVAERMAEGSVTYWRTSLRRTLGTSSMVYCLVSAAAVAVKTKSRAAIRSPAPLPHPLMDGDRKLTMFIV